MPYPELCDRSPTTYPPLLTVASGRSTITDTIYPKRVNHIPELNRMGANIHVEQDIIFIEGVDELTGAEVRASDLRAGACLVVAGLMAKGKTTISGIENILRGYADIVSKLRSDRCEY